MKAALNRFITDNLFDASANLLEVLNIYTTHETKSPIPFEEIYADAVSSPMPMALRNTVNKLDNIYLVGAIDDDTLKRKQSSFDLKDDLDGKYLTMLVFAAEVKDEAHLTRSEIAILTRGFNRLAPQLPVVLILKSGLRLSLATCERTNFKQNWRDGEKLGRVSILRNINLKNPHRGHIDILKALGDKPYPNFDELYKHWMQVFSTELLTKRFYTELSEWYAWVINSGKVKFPNDIRTTEDDMKYNHEAVIRLITRLIFVWFLKQKHLIPEEFFNKKDIAEKFIENFDPQSNNTLFYNPEESKYYRLILQNLFFAMLNRPIKDEETGKGENRRFRTSISYKGGSYNPEFNVNNLLRYEKEFKADGAHKLLEIANSQIPFLNGGLFECLDHKDTKDAEYGMYYDGFSENKNSLAQLSFPDYFFFGDENGLEVDLSKWYDDRKKSRVKVRGLLNILNSYNFTVEENTPMDQEVSLDPELLGKVFENLLASYNPETNSSARKQTGSFYTPREIVQYMVDETLVSYLKRRCENIDEALLRNLLDYSSDNFSADENVRKDLMKALHECKVLDPACGSGAFPMGMLQQMVHALRKLDPQNKLWKEFIIAKSLEKDKEAYELLNDEDRKKLRDDIEQSFNRQVNDPDYARKLYLIENCIYGVDIQPIATQISKLRFFISLVAEQNPTNDPDSNFGIRPLPNLESKFVAANTLLPLEKTNNLFDSTDQLEKIKKELTELNHKLFRAKNNTVKKNLKAKMENLRKDYSQELVEIGSIGPNAAEILAGWNMFNQNSTASFFDSVWMFGIENGFDIVIGNPPYIQLQSSIGKKGIDKKGREYDMKLGDLYIDKGYLTFAKTGDIYCLFYEQANNLLRDNGVACYITSNKWMRAGYGVSMREYFSKHTNPKLLIDFGGIQVFESATVDTNILLFAKEKNQKSTLATVIGKENKIKNGSFNLSDFIEHNASPVSFPEKDSWVILSPIEQSIKRKIEAVGTPLKDWDIQINYGIKTGYNEAFIITTEKRNEILANCRDEKERERTEALIRPILRGRDIKRYGYDWAGLYLIATFPSRHYDIEEYPAVKNYLLSFGMERLEQTGKEYIVDGQKVKARKKTNNKWFETQDSISYWEDFSKPKVIYPNMTKYLPFVYDDSGFFTNQKCFFINTDRPAYLTAFFNSSLFKYCFRDDFPELQGGTRELSKIFFEKIPILKVSEAVENSFKKLITMMQIHPSHQIAKDIDMLIYRTYTLSSEEQNTIGDIEIQ